MIIARSSIILLGACVSSFLFQVERSAAEEPALIPEPLYGGALYGVDDVPVAGVVTARALCSGVPVASRFVVTAKHCVRIKRSAAKKGAITIYIGSKKYTSKDLFLSEKDDIALIKTGSRISSAKARISTWNTVPVGQVIFVAGFGKSGVSEFGYLNGGYLAVLQNTGTSFVGHNSYEGTMPCSGDSGGPALVLIRGRVTVVGVLSTSTRGCPLGGYSFYVNTGNKRVRKFITETIADHQ